MSYQPTNWQDRVVEKPRTFDVTNNPDGSITLDPKPGAIVQEGTPVNAANMNKIEQGLVSHMADYAKQQLDAWNQKPGYRYVTKFDAPTVGSITEQIIDIATSAVVGSRVIEFDVPEPNAITVTLQLTEPQMHVRKVTRFDVPEPGAVSEEVTEVME